MKKKSLIALLICAVLCSAFSFIAFAEGGHDTPIIPIHTKHYYYLYETTKPTCTEEGQYVYKCHQCTKTYTEAIEPLGHMFTYGGNHTSEGAELECSFCDTSQFIKASQLEAMWSLSYINAYPERTASSNTGYLDLDGNEIINAKDYSIIIRLKYDETNQ